MRASHRLILLLIGGLLSSPAPASAPSGKDLRQQVDAYLAPLVTMRDYAGAVLIARGGKVLVSHGYGPEAAPDAAYGIGSLTKTFTSALVLGLVEEGRLGLDDPIDRYLPGFRPQDRITVRQLLEHGSGLKDYYGWAAYASGRASPISREAFLHQAAAEPLDFAPGTRSSYSNTGYYVLAAIVEKVSGLPYAEAVRQRILRPLGMKRSGNLADGEPVRGLAAGRDPGFPPALLQPAAKVSRSWLLGNGSMYATAPDLLKWLRHVRSESARWSALPYPYGWGKRNRFGRDLLEQNGRIPQGYASYAAVYPADDLEVVVLGNIQAEVSEKIGVDLAAIALGEACQLPKLRAGFSKPVPPDPARLAGYAGRYQIAPGFVLTVRDVPQGLLLAGPDGAFLPLDADGEDRFFFRPLYVHVSFKRDAEGRIAALDWNGQAEASRL